MLLTPGLKPVDLAFESWWVRPGGATRVRVRPGDQLTVVDPDGGQPAELLVVGDDPEALGVRPDAPATVLGARDLVPDDARAIRLFGTDGPPGARETFVARSDAGVVVARPAAASSTATGPRRRWSSSCGGPSRARPRRPSCPRRWPSRGSTSGSTRPPRSPTRSARASTSRSSTWPAVSVRTFWPSTRTSSTRASSAAWTRRSRAR